MVLVGAVLTPNLACTRIGVAKVAKQITSLAFGSEIGRYLALGSNAFILDVPFDREELDHAAVARVRGAVEA